MSLTFTFTEPVGPGLPHGVGVKTSLFVVLKYLVKGGIPHQKHWEMQELHSVAEGRRYQAWRNTIVVLAMAREKGGRGE